ncbi:MAG: hypothetical protein LDL56_00515 [Armatimonadetes bacterium]|nr:hypothetical protein [Armatimonadota bacterium]MCA1995693.1 hypothetical protein [Armatimonadota bacterium]
MDEEFDDAPDYAFLGGVGHAGTFSEYSAEFRKSAEYARIKRELAERAPLGFAIPSPEKPHERRRSARSRDSEPGGQSVAATKPAAGCSPP